MVGLQYEGKDKIYVDGKLYDKEYLKEYTSNSKITDLKRYSKDGVKSIEGFTDKDNLIIKGENLKVLYKLLDNFKGKVKLIYIDPPYNTGKNREYKDNFTREEWLTFMKNRLEVARELLRDDGVIFAHCDDNEQAYLKVLMDEVFGKENFVSNIITRATPNGRDYGLIAKMHEHILFYAKKIAISSTNLIEVINKSFSFSDAIGDFNIHPLYNSNVRFNINTSKNLYYPFYVNPNKVDNNGFYEISLEQKEGWVEVFPPKSVKEGIQFIWRWGREKSFENLNKEIVGHKLKNGEFRVVQKMRGNEQLARTIWDETEISNRRGTEDLQKLFNKKVFSYPKSEHLLKKIIHMATNLGDIVLDYHLGSGTTCAVAHKMGRQYIGVEQMDYIETIPVERLKKVIEGEQGGISKEVEWKGGGNFIYGRVE